MNMYKIFDFQAQSTSKTNRTALNLASNMYQNFAAFIN